MTTAIRPLFRPRMNWRCVVMSLAWCAKCMARCRWACWPPPSRLTWCCPAPHWWVCCCAAQRQSGLCLPSSWVWSSTWVPASTSWAVEPPAPCSTPIASWMVWRWHLFSWHIPVPRLPRPLPSRQAPLAPCPSLAMWRVRICPRWAPTWLWLC